jgi:outer membrane protein assembly factor BamB
VAAANSGPALSGGGSGAEPWTLRNGTTTTAGGWASLDVKTGTQLWSFDSGGACNAGPSISDGMVFWGTGTFSGFGPKKVFAFGLN